MLDLCGHWNHSVFSRRTSVDSYIGSSCSSWNVQDALIDLCIIILRECVPIIFFDTVCRKRSRKKKKKKKSRSLQYNVEIKHRFRWSVAFRFHVSFTSVHRRSLSHRHYNVRICSSLPQLCVNTTWVLHKVTSCLLLFLTQTLTTFRNCTRTCYMKQRRSFPSRSLAK